MTDVEMAIDEIM